MTITEAQHARIDELEEGLEAASHATEPAARRESAARLLGQAVEVWFAEHREHPAAYAAALDAMNREADWTGDDRQLPVWTAPNGELLLLPPKFFGGDVSGLHDNYVLSISLNHAILGAGAADAFATEISDQQTPTTMTSSCRDYFSKPYAYRPFFSARAKMLAAYAEVRGRPCAPGSSWQDVNARWSLYIERLPTRSRSCGRVPAWPRRTSFVRALNEFAHDVVFALVPPGAILLAGKANRDVLPGIAWRSCGELVRPDQTRSCPVDRGSYAITGGRSVPVIRCNFLRTVNGPNSDVELVRLGRLLAGAAADSPV
jgi:hypothetical protein